MPQKIFCLIKTCALIPNSLFYSVEHVTFSPAVNVQCQPNMPSIKQSLRSCPWKEQIYFNWNGLFTCQKKYIAWFKPALWSLSMAEKVWTQLKWYSARVSITLPHPSRQLFALQRNVFWCQEKAYYPTSAKASHLRSHAQCGVQSFISCAEVFHHGAEILKGHRPAAEDHRHTASDQLFSNIYYIKTCVVLFF